MSPALTHHLISPILLFAGCALGAIGICLALPRKGVSPQILGALVGALALGLLFIGLAAANPGRLPNYNFYVFSAIALGASLRVISHPRPVYAALYFILTILASCGLYVLLSAEFMAFALVIVYAGAILITYLFVIMLATETPTADAVEALGEYDRYSREPLLASVVGLILLAGLTTLFARGLSGSGSLQPATSYAEASRIALLPRRLETELRRSGLMQEDERIARAPAGAENAGELLVDLEAPAATGGVPGLRGSVTIAYGEDHQQTRVITSDDPRWPHDLALTNPEGVGFNLLADHPGAIEIAGVILLMAMLGAVVLARKKVEMDEAAKLQAWGVATVHGAPLVEVEGGGNGHVMRKRAASGVMGGGA